ncbi:MAG: ribonuclease protein component [Micromonosporaceae bacterium]|nr:ribonuclease protein component [Micromonosporaceae bacterium]
MLAAAQRLRRREDFAATIRAGRRAGRGVVVVHLTGDTVTGMAASDLAPVPAGRSVLPARAGFVVSKAVGNAVVRNTVRRRLRHLIRPHLAGLPADAAVVVRALPGAAARTYPELAADLDAALTAASARRSRPGRRR